MRQIAFATAVSAALFFGGTSSHATNNIAAFHQTKKHAVTTAAKKASAPQPTPATPQPVTVTVAPGDTLTSIAAAHNTTYIRIFDANEQIADPDIIHVGWELRIPTADEQLPDRPLPTAPVVAVPTATTPAPSTAPAPAAAASYALPDDAAKAFIYSRESGNNPNATNPSGCYGLGQDCNGVVRSLCGADYACQDQYFTSYALRRYGSWAGAVAFWQTHGWW